VGSSAFSKVLVMTTPVTRFLPEIVQLCSRPLGPKLEIQHNKKRKRSVPTLLTREE
jgi:hypothetical protein